MSAETSNSIDQNLAAPLKLGFSSPDLNNRFHRYLEGVIVEYGRKNNIDFLVADAIGNIITQQVQVRDLIRQGIQGLIVAPVDTSAMGPITAMAKEAGIPLVYVSRNPYPTGNFPEGVYFVGSNEVEIGRMLGEFLGANLISGNVGALLGPENNEASLARLKGLQDVLSSKYPNIKIIAREIANWERKEAYAIVKRWIQKYGKDLNAIAGNDEMALGAIEALKEAGRNDVLVVGVNGLTPAQEAIRDGTLAATIFRDANTQGETAVNIILGLLRGEKPAQQINLIPLTLITSSNLSEYLKSIK